MPAITFVGNLNYVAIAVVGGLRVATGAMLLGSVQAFIQYSRQFSQNLSQLAQVANILQSGVASAERVFELLDEPEEAPDSADAKTLSSPRGAVQLDAISFRYKADVRLIDGMSLADAMAKSPETFPRVYTAMVQAGETGGFLDLVLAQIAGRTDQAIIFTGHSDGVTDSLHIYAPPSFSADIGKISARIVALDRNQVGVGGAHLTFEAVYEDEVLPGKITEIGDGIYEGLFSTRTAGRWTMVVRDSDTGAKNESPVVVVPAEPRKLAIVEELDARSQPPYDLASVRVRLEDRFRNGVDPERIRCEVSAGAIEPASTTELRRVQLLLEGSAGRDNQ